MAGIRHAAAAAVDADITQLLADLQTYFALEHQTPQDIDIRGLFVRHLHGALIGLDERTAQAARFSNVEDPWSWRGPLVQLDPFANP
jgi:hypothetical protein